MTGLRGREGAALHSPPTSRGSGVGGEIADEVGALRTEIIAELRAREKRWGKTLRAEFKAFRAEAKADLLATENRLRADFQRQVRDALLRQTMIVGLQFGMAALWVIVLMLLLS